MADIKGRFTKLGLSKNGIVVGLIGSLTEENITHDNILSIAAFYNISTVPDKFGYHFITKSGAIRETQNSRLLINNYNGFLEIFK